MNRPELSVVIPVYNEEKRVGKTLQESFAYLKSKKIPAEILVVDDGSRDKTVEVVSRFKRQANSKQSLRVLKHGVNRGKGAAVRTGALAAKGRTVLYMDADNSTPLSEFESFRPILRQGTEVILGSRAVDRKKVKIHQPFYREVMGRVFNLLVQLIAIPGLWDTQCGFKAFSQKAARKIFLLQTIERFGFDVELLYIAHKHRFPIKEVSVQWFDSPHSKVSVLKDSTRMFTDLLVIRWNDMRGRYDSRPEKQ
jgi:dolichyl-phosphate beta-glucosyltransferase